MQMHVYVSRDHMNTVLVWLGCKVIGQDITRLTRHICVIFPKSSAVRSLFNPTVTLTTCYTGTPKPLIMDGHRVQQHKLLLVIPDKCMSEPDYESQNQKKKKNMYIQYIHRKLISRTRRGMCIRGRSGRYARFLSDLMRLLIIFESLLCICQ